MAGHSQFKNIMHRKGRQDAVKSKLFGKLAREITVSAKIGLPDPAMNPRLRAAIIAARAENMPKDNIDRAIKKAAGGDGENYEEIRYEGYGPGGVAVIVEVLTDNRNRTAGEVRATFTKSGGNLAETGAVSFMFDHVGVIEYDAKAAGADAMFEAALEAGADDVVSNESGHEIYAAPDRFGSVAKALEDKVRRAAQSRAGLAAAKHRGGRRRAGREAVEVDRELQRAGRCAERLCEFRGLGRAGAKDERVDGLSQLEFQLYDIAGSQCIDCCCDFAIRAGAKLRPIGGRQNQDRQTAAVQASADNEDFDRLSPAHRISASIAARSSPLSSSPQPIS